MGAAGPPGPAPAAPGPDGAPGAATVPATAAEALSRTPLLAEDGWFEENPDAHHVLLELPWDRDNVVLARSTAGHLAVRAGFTPRETEDLRLAIDEACGLLLAASSRSGRTEPVACAAASRWRRATSPRRSTAPVRDLGDVAGAGGFGWTLLGALVDELERVAGDDDRLGVRITKWAAVGA